MKRWSLRRLASPTWGSGTASAAALAAERGPSDLWRLSSEPELPSFSAPPPLALRFGRSGPAMAFRARLRFELLSLDDGSGLQMACVSSASVEVRRRLVLRSTSLP